MEIMGNLALPESGDVYTLRIYKRLKANPLLEWANTYELLNLAGNQGDIDFLDTIDLFVNNEAAIHKNVVGYTRAVLSTWVPDGQPYNPATFITKDVSGVSGALSPGTDMLSLQNCLQVTRDVPFGRSGRSLYRGIVEEGMVTADTGQPRLTDGQYALTLISIEAMQLSISSALGGLGMLWVLAAKYGEGQVNTRQVMNLSLKRNIVVKKFNNRYFDRVG